MSVAKEFKEFVSKGNVMDLAIGVIIGAAFNPIVKSLVDDVIMPPIGLLLGKSDFTNLFLVLKEGLEAPGPYLTLEAAKAAGAVTMNFGVFFNTVMSFLVTAMAVFAVMKFMNRLRREAEKK